MTVTVGVDIGGTKVAVGVVNNSGQVMTQVRRPISTNDAAGTLSEIVELIIGLRNGHEVSAIGIGVAGLLDASRRARCVRRQPRLGRRSGPRGDRTRDRPARRP